MDIGHPWVWCPFSKCAGAFVWACAMSVKKLCSIAFFHPWRKQRAPAFGASIKYVRKHFGPPLSASLTQLSFVLRPLLGISPKHWFFKQIVTGDFNLSKRCSNYILPWIPLRSREDRHTFTRFIFLCICRLPKLLWKRIERIKSLLCRNDLIAWWWWWWCHCKCTRSWTACPTRSR